jgi:glycosyltransferase involved in cell wall biosynthesis
VLRVIRRFLADRIVYQSDFVVRNWEREFGPVKAPYDVIRNGIDLEQFTPEGEHERPTDRYRIMMLEGAYLGGHDFGLKLALDLAAALEEQYGFRIELMVAGKLTDEIIARWDAYARVPVIWKGIVPREEVPYLHRSAHLYFPVEINPACPNSVIEALACGLPVAAFDTGSLPELVGAEAGRLVPYGGDPWKLEVPGIDELVTAAAEVLQNQDRFRTAARKQAGNFAIQDVIKRYIQVLEQA